MSNKSPELQSAMVYPTRTGEGHGNLPLAEAAFITLRSGLGIIALQFLRQEGMKPINTTIDQYAPSRFHKARPFGITRVISLSDGFVLEKNTQSWLEDHAHRLTIPNPGDVAPEYSRSCFNVDFQAVPSQSIHVVGEDDIAKNADAMVQLLSFERDIVYGTQTGWTGYMAPVLYGDKIT